jgi:hypothetical protein
VNAPINAQLIASAPELVEALREVDGLHDLMVQDYPELAHVFRKARTLLRRVEGGAS